MSAEFATIAQVDQICNPGLVQAAGIARTRAEELRVRNTKSASMRYKYAAQARVLDRLADELISMGKTP